MEAAQTAVDIASSGVKTVPIHTFGGSVEHTLAHIEEAALHSLPCLLYTSASMGQGRRGNVRQTPGMVRTQSGKVYGVFRAHKLCI